MVTCVVDQFLRCQLDIASFIHTLSHCAVMGYGVKTYGIASAMSGRRCQMDSFTGTYSWSAGSFEMFWKEVAGTLSWCNAGTSSMLVPREAAWGVAGSGRLDKREL